MSDTTRTRRSPQEIVAQREADLKSAQVRAAIDAQMGNPLVKGLSDTIGTLSKARLDAKKGYNGNPNQTFANRIQSHSLWITEINAEKALADADIAYCDFITPKYRALRTEVATFLANGGDANEALMMVENGTDAIAEEAQDLNSEQTTTASNLAIATAARKAFIQSKKSGNAPQAEASV